MADRSTERKNDYDEAYNAGNSAWHDFNLEAQMDTEMYLNVQFTEAEASWANRSYRTLYGFNKIKRQVNLISGYEGRNRHILKIGPAGRDDDEAARQHTALTMHQMQVNNGYDMLSLAFKYGSLISGSNLLELWRDRENILHFSRRGYNSFLLDPMFTMPDLSDCAHILTGQFIREDKAKELLPQESENISNIKMGGAPNRWPGIPHRSEQGRYGLRLYEEFWERETEFIPTVIDRITGQEIPWKVFVKQLLGGDTRRANFVVENLRLPNRVPALSKYDKPQKKIKLTIFVDGEYVWEGDNPTGMDDYNFVWLGGEWLPEVPESHWKLQSFARVLRDPQRADNKRLNQVIDIVESQIQSLRLIREGALVNKENAWKSGQGVVLEVKKDVPGPLTDAFMQLPAPQLPGSLFQLMEVLDRTLLQCGGLNEEIMGSDDKDIPGVLSRMRTGQALTAQQGIFDGLRRAKRELGRKIVRLNQLNMTPQRVQRMIAEPPVPGFYDPDFTRFDCTPTEGLLTDSQQHLWYMELRQLRAEFPDMMGLIPPSELLKAAPVQYKRELMEMVKKAEQQQAQLAQYQLQQQDTMTKLMQAQAAADIAKAQEDRADAVFRNVQTAAEVQKLGQDANMELLDRLLRAAEINLKAQELRQSAKQVKAKGK